VTVSPATRMRAWRRETDGESSQTTAPVSRPSRFSPGTRAISRRPMIRRKADRDPAAGADGRSADAVPQNAYPKLWTVRTKRAGRP